jgi:UDP-2,3-diacylglucosamine hydrolase
MTTYFIADLHLSPERPAITRAFDQFIEQRASKADALYILGDLFEAWIGDDDPSPLSRHVIAQLRQLSEGGTSVYFQHGNRDFLVAKRFSAQTGATLLPGIHLVELYGRQVLVLHGDAMCLEDVDYQKFRRKVRLPVVRWLLTRLPLKKRMQIAADWRARSTEQSSTKAAEIMDVSPREVERLMRDYGVYTMIHGHTHRPARHPLQIDDHSAERIVVGDWGPNTWIVKAEPNTLELERLDIAGLAPETN